MRKTCLFVLLVFLTSLPLSLAGEKDNSEGRGWAMDAKAGTLGIGADISRSIVPRVLNLRVGASFFSHTADMTEKGIDYSARLKLGAVPIAVDVFPFKNWFRLGGGVVVNLTEAKGTGKASNGTYTIGDEQYPAEEIGEVNAKVKVNRAAPYFGIGFNNPIKRSGRLGFFTDFGFIYHGTPSASFTTTRSVSGLQAEIDKEIRDINEDIRDYKLFPVIQLGLSIRF